MFPIMCEQSLNLIIIGNDYVTSVLTPFDTVRINSVQFNYSVQIYTGYLIKIFISINPNTFQSYLTCEVERTRTLP